ncbi:MAG: methyltransferase domain-containing protein [Dehalococcoidia bacterium]|nr:methyltransferase domain-containing protein [Dehalococcoidia bacterium]
MLNTSNVFAWATGATRDTDAMKERVRKGYDGAFSDHVNHYDEVGSVLQMRSAAEQLRDVDVRGKSVLDIGGGTGVASFLMLRHGASKVVCGDISEKMLVQARLNAEREGYGPNLIEFCRLDAEVLPYDEGSFDVVSMSMTMGLLPNQEKSVAEMARVARPGGLVSIGAHGPDHYWEPIDATVRGMSKRYIFGYRLEFWPEKEKEVRAHMARAGLVDIMTRRVTWKNDFGSGGKAFDFFAAISASWWYGKLPPERVQEEADRTRAYFERENVRIVTDDIIVASGRKPG